MNPALQPFVTGLANAAQSPIFWVSAAFAIALVIIYHWAVVRSLKRAAAGPRRPRFERTESPDLAELLDRIGALEATAARHLQHVGFVRFNAFPDVGSELSYALAVVDNNGNGFLVSSIYSREEVRTYAKAIQRFAADKEVSAEEQQALQLAQHKAKGSSG